MTLFHAWAICLVREMRLAQSLGSAAPHALTRHNSRAHHCHSPVQSPGHRQHPSGFGFVALGAELVLEGPRWEQLNEGGWGIGALVLVLAQLVPSVGEIGQV